jgi:hypothetical protein
MLSGLYQRTLQPYDSPQEHHARHTIKPGIGMVVTPGGKTLSLGLVFSADVLFYDEDLVGSRNNRVMYTLEQETKWKIFPKTALISIVRFSPINYTGAAGVNNDSLPVRALLGIRGLLTPKFGLSLFVGYGASFYSKGDDFDHVIANGELMFFITPFTDLRLGGERDFVSFYSNFYVKSGGYLKFAQMIGRLFQITLKGEVYYRDYSHVSGQYGYVDTPNTDDRRDTRFGASLLLEFRATEWLTILASGVYQGNLSNFAYSQDLRTDTLVDFQRFEVLGGVQAHY